MAMEGGVSHSLVKALRNVPAFATLDDDHLIEIVGESSNLMWSEGSIVFEQGDPGDGLYIVLSGGVRIYDNSDGDHEVARIGPGDYFGEISLLNDAPRTKSAAAVEDSELLVLPRESFRRLLDGNAQLEAHVRERIEQRLAGDAAVTEA